MKKQTNILIIILVLLVIGLIGYIVYDNIISKKEVKKTTTKTIETKKEISKEDLNVVGSNLLNFISENRLDALNVYGMKNLTQVAIDKICYGKSECTTIDGNSVKQYIKNVFNQNVVLQDAECFNEDGVLYKYNSTTNTFTYNTDHLGHGGINYESIYSKIYSIKKVSGSYNQYILIVNKLFYSAIDDSYIKSSPSETTKVMDLTDDITASSNTSEVDVNKLKAKYDANYGQYKDIGPKYEYTFVKRSNGTYYLQKFEIIG